MARLVLSWCLALVFAAPAHAAAFQELEGFLAFSVGSASSCSGPGECIAVDVSLAPSASPSDTILFDLHVAWDPGYWVLREIAGAGAVQRDDALGFIDDLFGDVGTGAPIPAGATLFRLVFEVAGPGDPLRARLEIGNLSARDPFFDRAVLVADSGFRAHAPTPNSLLLVPEPGTALLLGMGLGALALRRRRAALAFAALAALACSDGGRVPEQRTFLWHGGPANESGLSPAEENPFRGRVAPSKPLRLDLGALSPDAFGAADPRAIRFHEGDATLNPAALAAFPPPRIDPLDPVMAHILAAPDDVLLDLRGLAAFGAPGLVAPARLSSTFPGRFTLNVASVTGLSPSPDLGNDFGGDFSGEVQCLPFNPDITMPVSDGTLPADPTAQCIESSSTGGGPGTPGNLGLDPGEPKGSYTPPGLTKMEGGTGELPLRPAPDRSSLLASTPNDAQGLFIPSRGMRLGQPMEWERNVDPATGRPLVARVGVDPIGSCAAAGELVPDALNAGGLAYNSALASHPFSVTPGAPVFDASAAPALSELRRGGVGTDPGCLRPGGAPGEANAFAFDASVLADTNALQNHHANQGLFASLCRATLPFEVTLDNRMCVFNLFGSRALLNTQLLPISLTESLTALFAGEQSGAGGPQQFLGLFANAQKGPVLAAQNPPVPLAGLNRLFNNPASPFDRNLDGNNGDTGPSGCGNPFDPATCDLGGFDGFDGRVQIPGRQPTGVSTSVQPFLTVDKSLSNEQRALGGCGPFYASRCDSSLPYRNTVSGLSFGGYGGLDLLNAEASALLEAVRAQGALGSTTSSDLQPGTVGFDGPPVCMRRLASGALVRLPGCRGVQSLRITTNGAGDPVVFVAFDPGYLPSVDGCVIGTRIARSGSAPVPVVFDPSAPAPSQQLQAELALCNAAVVRRVVPNRLLVDDDMDGSPDLDASGLPLTIANLACTGAPVGIGASSNPLRVCNAANATLEQLPLIHPLAGCVASDAHFAALGADDCRYWMYRDLVAELLDGTAQLFRSEVAALSWNLTAFLSSTSCDIYTPDAAGNVHDQPSGPLSLAGDPQCYTPALPYDASRCSLAAPQFCKNVRAVLGLAPPNQDTLPDQEGDGVAQDGDGSGVAGDSPCLTHESLGCDDNCPDTANTRQVNANGLDATGSDDFGNACDPDLDNDGDVDPVDTQLQQACFQGTESGPGCADADLVGDGSGADPDPGAIEVDGYDRLQMLRWLRGGGDPGGPPGV